MSLEDQFDVAAQDRRADAARRARIAPPAVEAEEIERLPEPAPEVEVPEAPAVDQEPEIQDQDDLVTEGP